MDLITLNLLYTPAITIGNFAWELFIATAAAAEDFTGYDWWLDKNKDRIEEMIRTYQQPQPVNNFINTNQMARFDFWINSEYLIEYDGIQHFEAVGWGDDVESAF